MPDDTDMAIFDELDDLLDQERAALLAGQLGTVTRLLDRKVALIDRLDADPPGARDQLAGLQDKVMRNQTLLEASLKGIRAVSSRLAAMRRVQRDMQTYDSQGRKTAIAGASARRVERRA